MPIVSLRKSGGSVTVTVPPPFLKATGLSVGSEVLLEMIEDKLTITPVSKRVMLSDILAAAPRNTVKLRAAGWDELSPAGREA